MNYSVVQRKNPQDKESEALYYAQPVWGTEIGIRKIASQISKYSTLTAADIAAVLEAFLDLLPDWLKEGHSVRLGDFGIIRIMFKSDGKDTADDVSSADINHVRAVFRGSSQLKKELSDLSFEKVS